MSDGNGSALEGEVVESGDFPHPFNKSTALARPRDHDPTDVGEQVRQHVEKASLAMELRWEEERKLRDQWDEEDKLEGQRVTLTAMIAAGVLGEGAAGNRMRADQLAAMACEYADEILKELAKYVHRDKAKREARRKAEKEALSQEPKES